MSWKTWKCCGLGLSLLWLVLPAGMRADEAADRLTLAVDALTRLENVDLRADPAMKERILRVVERTRGTANFVRLVRHFALPDQEEGLLDVAAAGPREEHGIDAIKLVLNSGRPQVLAAALATGDGRSLALIEALGHSGHRAGAKLLAPLVAANGAERVRVTDRSRAVMRALARSAEGAGELLGLVKAGRFDDEARRFALDELSQVRWAAIKNEAQELRGAAGNVWPAAAELARRAGDPERGRALFFRANPGCYNCHVVKGQGVEVGPNLSEIGSKLAKDAMIQAILEPSAGISFGYEAYTFTLKDGEELYGLIASETPTEVMVRSAGGAAVRQKKSEIVGRQKSALSLMPAGLEAGMTPQEMVDLVAYLVSLKKPE